MNLGHNYEPPVTDPSVIAKVKRFGRLAPGVNGIAFATNKYIYIPMLVAVKEGNGDVGRFLDSLSPRCRIVDVVNDKLKGMLERRGWKQASMRLPRSLAGLLWDNDEDFIEDSVGVWVRHWC